MLMVMIALMRMQVLSLSRTLYVVGVEWGVWLEVGLGSMDEGVGV